MILFILGFGLGVCIGGMFGTVAVCLCVIRKETEEDELKEYDYKSQ